MDKDEAHLGAASANTADMESDEYLDEGETRAAGRGVEAAVVREDQTSTTAKSG